MTMTQFGMLFFYTIAIGGFCYLWGAFAEYSTRYELERAFRRERRELIEIIRTQTPVTLVENSAASRSSKRSGK